MQLEGSCHCGAVTFSLQAHSPVPFMHCHCSICRKTAGSGGYGINLGGDAATMKVRGRRHVGIYHAVMREPGQRATRSKAGRHFCLKCGSALWLWDPRWPELVHRTHRRSTRRCPSRKRSSKRRSTTPPRGSTCRAVRAMCTAGNGPLNRWSSGTSATACGALEAGPYAAASEGLRQRRLTLNALTISRACATATPIHTPRYCPRPSTHRTTRAQATCRHRALNTQRRRRARSRLRVSLA